MPAIRAEYLAALDAAPPFVVPDPLAAFAGLGHFYFAYYGCPLRQIHEATAATYRRLCPSLIYEAPHAKARHPARTKLRVAFVSANFHNHTINRFFAGLIVGLADTFDVLAVAAPGPDDQATAALRQAIPFIRLPRDLARARQSVAELAADVLVYLDIGMEPFTYFLAHARLAPVVTLPSAHLRGRMTAGLLRLADLDHGIADDQADYCRRAIEFAHDGFTYRAAISDQAGGLFQRRRAISDFASLLEQIFADA